jgi:hypothetical protein
MQTLFLPLLSMLLFSCYFGTDGNSGFDHDDANFDVAVMNETGRQAVLEYAQCTESGGGSPQMLVLPPGEEALIHVRAEDFEE